MTRERSTVMIRNMLRLLPLPALRWLALKLAE